MFDAYRPFFDLVGSRSAQAADIPVVSIHSRPPRETLMSRLELEFDR